MPGGKGYASKAQHRWMEAAESRGEVKPGTAHRWAHETKDMKRLPEKKRKAKRGRKRMRGGSR